MNKSQNLGIEEGQKPLLDFQKLQKVANQNVLPVVAQDIQTGKVLIVGYVNEEALHYSLTHRVATFWSTSRNELWVKGKTSGDYLDLVEVRVNCEQNALLYLVNLRGKGSCHTRLADGKPRLSCFYRKLDHDKLTFVES